MKLTNSQYNAVMRNYQQRQFYCRDIEKKRYKEISEAIPEIREIDDWISSNASKCALLRIKGKKEDARSLEEDIVALTKKKPALLAQNGYPTDYLDAIYICKDCHDTGYIGKKKCHCFDTILINLFYAQTNLSDILEEERFHNFSLDYYSRTEKDDVTEETPYALACNAVTESLAFVENFGQKEQNLLFTGLVGVGKTFLSHCIAGALIDKGYSVLYFTAFEFFELCGKAVMKGDAEARTLFDKCFSCDLLIIDDLGTETPNTFTLSQLFHCVNERIITGSATIISTNLNLDQLKALYSERTVSRLISAYTVIYMAGSDIRTQKTLAKHKEDY